MTNDEGTGWLIEKGQLCLGTTCNRMTWVSFTDPSAIRFSRKQDAENTITILRSFGAISFGNTTITEHKWVGPVVIDTDDGKSPSLDPTFLSALSRGNKR